MRHRKNEEVRWREAGLVLIALFASGCAITPVVTEGPEIRARVIRSEAGEPLVFPEKVVPNQSLEDLFARSGNNGICFSGGGTRALTVAFGSLRAMASPELNLIEKTRYLSCNSGGSWASSTFTYYRSGAEDDTEFLGRQVSPENRRNWEFSKNKEEPTKPSWETLSATTLGHTATMNFKEEILKFLIEGPAHEAWQKAVGEVFFKPFGLYDYKDPKFFSFDTESVDRIVDANREFQPQWSRDNFVTQRPDRPYLIVNATILWPTQLFRPINRVSIQYTPLGVGNAGFVPLEIGGLFKEERLPTGGGFVAPFAFQSSGPLGPPAYSQDGTAWVDMPSAPYPFSIWQASGMSSAAYGAALARVDMGIVPEADYWAVGEGGETPSRTIRIGDGGNLENLGLLALLQRQVKKIVVFNSAEYTLKEVDSMPIDKDSNLSPLFGYTTSAMPHNTVFRKDQYQPLIDDLIKEKQAGNLPMVKKTYQVLRNDWWRIEPYEVEILWVYNDISSNWADQLGPGVKARVLEGANQMKGMLSHFPNYRTIGEEKDRLVEMTPQQVTLLADMFDWSLRQPKAKALLRSMLDSD